MTKPVVLLVNHALTRQCGVHGLGRRMQANLVRSEVLDVAYVECEGADHYRATLDLVRPDVAIFVYSSFLMPWVPEAITPHPPIRIAVPMNYDPIDQCMADHADVFDYLMVLDSALETTNPRVFAVGRALPRPAPKSLRSIPHTPPLIGSFGFAFGHKGFHTLAGVINAELDAAVYNLHMTEAHFSGYPPGTHTRNILQACADAITKPGVELRHTDHYVDDDDVPAMLAANDVNCLWYHPGQPNPGLASALDYVIAARRPILLTDATNFHGFTRPGMTWPATTLPEVLADWPARLRMAEDLYDEVAALFVGDVERVVLEVL